MTSPWPDSPLLIAIRKLRRMAALSAALQARASIDYDAALTRIWTEYVPSQSELIHQTGDADAAAPVRPYAAIWPMNTGFGAVSGGSQVWTLPDGLLHFYIACDPLLEITNWNARREEAIGFLDQWLADVMALSGADDPESDDGLGFLTITKAASPLIDHTPFKSRETTADFYFQNIALKYGDET